MTKTTNTGGADTPPAEQQGDMPAPIAPAALPNPTEGGSYIRKPDGSLAKQEG